MGQIPVVDGTIVAPLNDFDTYPVNTFYVGYDEATSGLIAHYPEGAYQNGRFVIITLEATPKNPVISRQIFLDFHNKMFVRREWGSWGSWEQIANESEITSIYETLIPIINSYNNNGLIRPMGQIPVVDGTIVAPLNDFDTYPVNTFYVGYDEVTSGLIAHSPTDMLNGRFVVLTLDAQSEQHITGVQVIFHANGLIYYRKEWGSWSNNWHRLLNENDIAHSETDYWDDKSIVWIGTSIPAGGRGPNGTTNNGSYPFRTREILGDDITIINNAVGSSCLWVLKKSLISESNPYGFDFSYPWERVERCIGLSFAEKQWMIDNRSNWSDAPTTLSAEDIQRIRNYSYENLVTPYINDKHLWIFDNANNEDSADEFGIYEQSEPFARYSTKGTLQFLWNMILTKNPKSSIFVLGNYYTDWGVHGRQNEFFESLANTWTLPWFPVWKHIPASPEVPITTTGGWVNGQWDDNAFPNGHTLTMKQIFCADGLHPHSDLSGKANAMLGRIIGQWINQQAVWFDGK